MQHPAIRPKPLATLNDLLRTEIHVSEGAFDDTINLIAAKLTDCVTFAFTATMRDLVLLIGL